MGLVGILYMSGDHPVTVIIHLSDAIYVAGVWHCGELFRSCSKITSTWLYHSCLPVGAILERSGEDTDPTYWSISIFSTNNPSDLFTIFHHASRLSMMTFHCHNILIRALSCMLSHYSWIIEVNSADFDCFDSFLNFSIDFTNILNYLIPWDIDYTQACTTPRTKIQSKHSSDHTISLQPGLQASNRITYM
jgi:hypothetical protein